MASLTTEVQPVSALRMACSGWLLHLLCTRSMLFIIPSFLDSCPLAAQHTGHCTLGAVWLYHTAALSHKVCAELLKLTLIEPGDLFRYFESWLWLARSSPGSGETLLLSREPVTDPDPCFIFLGRFFHPPNTTLAWKFWQKAQGSQWLDL